MAETNQPGDFIWYELMTGDADAAQAFYGAVMGWAFSPSGAPGMDYRMIHAPEATVAGLLQISPDMAAGGARPNWLGYVSVADVDAAAARVVSRGGAVHMPPTDIAMAGRIAMVSDPQGAPFYIMTPNGEGVSTAFSYGIPRVGHCAWNELLTPDQGAAWTIYGELFGWKHDGDMDMGPMGQYQFIRHGELIGAMVPSPAPQGRSHWRQYFRVSDIDAALAAIEAGGGQVLQAPQEIPGGDFSLDATDFEGSAFGLVGKRL